LAKSPDTTVDATVLDSDSQLFEDFLGIWDGALLNTFEQIREIAVFYKSQRGDTSPVTIGDMSGTVNSITASTYNPLRAAGRVREVRPESCFAVAPKAAKPQPVLDTDYMFSAPYMTYKNGQQLVFEKGALIKKTDWALITYLVESQAPVIPCTPEAVREWKRIEADQVLANVGTNVHDNTPVNTAGIVG